MKKLFKKSIACLIAVLMVVSTMPFAAIAAQAADTSALLSAMQSFETKMDGSVYTNMDTAYSAYVAASKAYDAAYYGGDASVDVTTPATNLNNAVLQMTKTNLTPYTANNPRPAFNSGTVPENAYNSVLYTNKKNSNEAFSVDISGSDVKFQVGYSETVLMYSDSNNAPSMPVMFVVRKNGTGQTRSRYVYSVYPTTSSGSTDTHTELVLNDMWYSSGSSKWNFQNEYGNTSYRVGHNYDTRNAGLEMRTAWGASGYVAYANVLKFNTKSSWGSEYYKSYKNLNWNAYVGGGNLSTDLHGTGAVNDNASIYVINYLPLKNAITADANKSARQNVASYKEGGMSTYLAGCLSAESLNPNNYSYSTDLAGQVSKCASDISTAVTKFTTTPTADNTANYPKLRNAFDYSGTLTGFNNVTYSVRNAYNGGVNNGFTQASYDNFKAKYEAAQNVMKAVATTGYVNDGFAGDAATALLTAFNALQHEHSFTGAYVNNNDGTHSQKCAFYDKCQTLSTGVAHSYNSSVTTQPTCTTAGVTTHTCVCGYSYTTNEPAATGVHNYTQLVSAKQEATCTTPGKEAVYKCATCDLTTGGETIDKIGHDMQVVEGSAKAPTCTVAGKEADKACSRCDYKETGAEIPALGHDYKYAQLDADNHTVTCSRCDYEVQEAHNFEGGNTCTKCLYEKSTIDTTAYDNAVEEYEAIIGADDYAAKYTEASRTSYQEAVEAAKKESFATKEEVDAATSAIISAQALLAPTSFEINVYVARENVEAVKVDSLSRTYTYGDVLNLDVTDSLNAEDQIAKWVIYTKDGKVNTKIASVDRVITMVATEKADVYVHIADEKETEETKYSKVSFISKNGAVSSVQYLEVGKSLDTSKVPKVEIPFYKFVKWNKALVTADGNDIEVKAVYDFIGTEENKCRVHYEGFENGEKEYTYDSFVYLFGAEDKTLALASDTEGTNIITYLNENAFYAPHTADIYVITVAKQQPSIGITGSYASSTDTKKTAAFNCKFFLPAGCTVVEYGLTATSSTGKSIKIKAEAASARGEYCVKVSMAKTSPVTSVEGVAYLTYKDAENYLHTIYSTPVTQNL